MQNNLWHHSRQEELEQAERKPEGGPIVPALHSLERVTLEVHTARKVHLVESLHGDLALAVVSGAILLAVEVEVVLYRSPGIFGLLILTRRNGRRHRPVDHENWDSREDRKEDRRVEATASLASNVGRD